MVRLIIGILLLGYTYESAAQDGYINIKSESGKYGIWWKDKETNKPKKSKWVLDPEYDSIILHTSITNPYTPGDFCYFGILYKKGSAGLFRGTRYGKYDLLLKADFDKIKYSKGQCAVLKKGKWGVYNGFNEKLILPNQYDQVEMDTTARYSTETALLKKSGKTGVYQLLYDYWILEPQYDTIIKSGNIYMASNNGKMGAYFNKYDSYLKSVVSFPIIPQGIYQQITMPFPESDLLIVDSMGRKGVWVMNRYEKKSNLLIEAGYDSIQLVRQDKSPVFAVYNNGERGEFNSNGWIIKPGKSAPNKKYNIMGTLFTIHYLPGEGFDILWTEQEENKKLHITDKGNYDSFDLDGDILIAKSGKKITGYFIELDSTGIMKKTRVLRSQLLFSNADSLRLFPESGGRNMYMKERLIVYGKSGEYGWWNTKAGKSGGVNVIQGPLKLYNIKIISSNKYKSFGAPLLLVNDLGKYGIITSIHGKWLVPSIYDSYKQINDSCIIFREKSKSRWNLFNAAKAHQLTDNNLHEEFRGLSWFIHNGKETTEFDTVVTIRLKNVFKINGNWFFIKNRQTVSTNIFGNGDELQKISKNNSEFVVFEKNTGTGIRRNGKEIVAPYLPEIL